MLRIGIMVILSKPIINPWLFYSGKIAGYICIFAAILRIIGLSPVRQDLPIGISYMAYSLILLGITLSAVSFFNMGNSGDKKGQKIKNPPKEKLKPARHSRNPLYMGMIFLVIAAVIFSGNYVIAALGIYSIVIYLLIIKR